MELQKQLCNGNWVEVPPDQIESRIQSAVQDQARKNAVSQKFPLLTRDQILDLLVAGKEVKTGTDWYECIRIKQEPKKAVEVELVRCSCGHSVRNGLQMSTSTGSSCADCYDRMSE